jgi:hypothetical protein
MGGAGIEGVRSLEESDEQLKEDMIFFTSAVLHLGHFVSPAAE